MVYLVCFIFNRLCLPYQRYLYPIDKKRVNEFGFSGEEEEKPVVDSDQESIGESGDGPAEPIPVEEKKDQ